MPRNKGNKKRIGAKRDGAIVPFSAFITGLVGASGNQINANPTGITGPILIEADTWCLFRLRSLRFRLHRLPATVTPMVACYTVTIQDTPPATNASCVNVIPHVILTPTATEPSEWCVVSVQDLAGPFPYYKSIPGTADVTEEVPGQICISGAAADTFQLEVEGVMQFKGMVSAGNTPEELQLRKALRDLRIRREVELARQSLLRVLAPGNAGMTYPCSVPK